MASEIETLTFRTYISWDWDDSHPNPWCLPDEPTIPKAHDISIVSKVSDGVYHIECWTNAPLNRRLTTLIEGKDYGYECVRHHSINVSRVESTDADLDCMRHCIHDIASSFGLEDEIGEIREEILGKITSVKLDRTRRNLKKSKGVPLDTMCYEMIHSLIPSYRRALLERCNPVDIEYLSPEGLRMCGEIKDAVVSAVMQFIIYPLIPSIEDKKENPHMSKRKKKT